MGDRVDRWLEQALPPTEEDSGRQDVQLAILKERMRTRRRARRTRRLRGGAVVVSLAALGVFFGGVVDLGGDSFELEEYEGEYAAEKGMKIYRNEFRGGGLGVPEDMPESEVQELNQQVILGEGVILAVAGWTMGENSTWSFQVQRLIEGETRIIGDQVTDPPSNPSRALLEFYNTEWQRYAPDIESGALHATGRRTMEFDNMPFAVEYWIIDTDGFGEVTYYEGVPIR